MNQHRFDELITWATGQLAGAEVLLANVSGESTDFIRFNGGKVRQAGSIEQAELGLELIDGARHAKVSLQLGGEPSVDRARVTTALATLRDQLPTLPDDPYLLYNTDVASSEAIGTNAAPEATDALDRIRTAAGDRDLVGIYCGGQTTSGFANSLGQRNWFEASTFNFDWTFYVHGDKAAKNLYAGFEWDDAQFAQKVAWSEQQLEALARPPMDLAPGGYRTFLTPAALGEFIDLISWQSFGIRSHRTQRTALLRMVHDDTTLAPQVSMAEDTGGGVAPKFQEQGFTRPDRVELITDGVYRDTLVSPRSAKEYDVETNGASAGEYPDSLAIEPGTIAADRAIAELDTGLYVGNLWYTNFSDRPACRVTGMTRFATFWVEGGEIVAPVNVLRFDDTIYNMLGDQLVGLTDDAEVMLDPMSYGERSNASLRAPGVLVGDMRFTL